MSKPLPALLIFVFLTAAVSQAADVEYSTTGAMDTPATMGGDRDGWGTEFLTRWDNDTGHDVVIDELGWPCGGWWAQFWYVWITSSLPADPYTLDYYGSFVATIEDDTEWPPSAYTYIDMSDEEIIIPSGASMYFGYSSPGMAGQISFNGTETYSWFNETWEMDGAYGRTTVMQFKGTFMAPAAVGETPGIATLIGNHPNPFNPATTITLSLPRAMVVTLDLYSLQGRLVRRFSQGSRNAGTHQVIWDGTDTRGHAAPSGTYLVRMVSDDGVETRKIVLAK